MNILGAGGTERNLTAPEFAFGLSRSHRPEDFAERRLATRQDLPERSLGLDFFILSPSQAIGSARFS